MTAADNHVCWWKADEGDKHSHVFSYVSAVEREQSDIYERFYRLAYLYDPYDHNLTGGGSGGTSFGSGASLGSYGGARNTGDSSVSENIVASNVDTAAAILAATEVRARFMTDGGNWSTQRRARHLEFYAEGLGKRLEVHQVAQRAAKDCALKGTALAKVFIDHNCADKIKVERVLIDDVVVDETECRASPPRQMHHRMFVDRDDLKLRYPEFEYEIDKAQQNGDALGYSSWRYWAGYRPLDRDEVVIIESWRLPVGVPGTDGYKPGVRVICIDGTDLEEEEWNKPFFPFARMVWSERTTGWFGIGLAERIAGHQRQLNKINWQIDRQLDQHAVPTTYVRLADARLAVATTNRAGTIVPIKGDYPKTVIPQAVSGETYNRRREIKESAYEETGVSQTAAMARKPAGLDSGVALREYKDQTTQRFVLQEKEYERFMLRVTWLILECCKDLGKEAPEVMRKAKYGGRRICWKDVDMGEVTVQMQAASNTSRTSAGRMQSVAEWAQAGIITQDEARRLMRHPDLEQAMSLYTAALEDLERAIEEILDGSEDVVPEPYQNLKMGVWRFQAAYLRAGDDGAPEEILERLREWIVLASYILGIGNRPDPAMEQPMAPGQPELEGMAPPMLPEGPPQQSPVSAIAPEAIGVRAV